MRDHAAEVAIAVPNIYEAKLIEKALAGEEVILARTGEPLVVPIHSIGCW